MTEGEIDRANANDTLAFRHIHNFRDYGGYKTPHGRLLSGRLFRSGQYSDADSDDLAQLAAVGLGAVIDLRGKSERAAAPCAIPAGLDADIILIDDETATRAPHIEAALKKMEAGGARDSMIRAYRAMPFGRVIPRLYARFFETLATIERPTLIHCMAGKDRTGMAVALFHHLVGVHPDDLMSDYLLTNTTGNIEDRVRAGRSHVEALFGSISSDALLALMSVEPDYLLSGFKAITDRCGSVDAYLLNVVGVTGDRRNQIIRNLMK